MGLKNLLERVDKWTWLAIGLNLVFVGVLLSPLPIGLRGTLSDWANLLLPLVNVGALLKARRGLPKGVARDAGLVPLLLGISTIVAVVAQGVYMLENSVFHLNLAPAWSDIFYLLGYPLVIAALLKWPTRADPQITRVRLAADALLITVALFAFCWYFVLVPILRQTDVTPFGAVVDISYPVLDFATVAFVLLLARRGVPREYAWATVMIALSSLIVVVSDLGFAKDALGGTYVTGRLLDAGWTVSLLLANWAGIRILTSNKLRFADGHLEPSETVAASSLKFWQALLPYLLLPAVGCLVIFVAYRQNDPFAAVGVYGCALVLLVVLLARQVISIKETNSLYGSLRAAFRQLEQRSEEVHEKAEESERLNENLREMAQILEFQNKSLAEANEQLEQLATRDGMTGICNHRAFQGLLRDNISAACRDDRPLSLLLMDVDFFKHYNDQFGHPAGDDVLRGIAQYLRDAVRPLDVPARYGGEEFAVILPNTDRDEATMIAERVRQAIASHPFAHRRVTLSIGVSVLADCATPEQLVEEADRALYFAKNRGRNQVVVAADIPSHGLALEPTTSKYLSWDPSTPMGMATIISAGMRCHPRALVLEPHAPLAAGLLATLEIKGAEMRGHSERVMWFAMRLAQEALEMGLVHLSEVDLRALAYGSVLHDLGKMGISDAILAHPSALTPEMRLKIELHPELGAELIEKFPNLAIALPLIKHHHERWDGAGYPSKLSGENIPKIARIFAIVDALEAMSSDRPYSAARPYEQIRKELEAQKGEQFDPHFLEAFLNIPPEEWDALRQHDPLANATPNPDSLAA